MARGTTTTGGTAKIARTLDLPFTGGWTMMAWSRVTGSMPGGTLNALFDLHRVGTFSSLGVSIDTTGGLGSGCGIFVSSGDTWEYIAHIGSTWTDFTNYHHFAVTFRSPNSAAGPFLKFYFDGAVASQTINSNVAQDAQYDEVAAFGTVSSTTSAAAFNQHFRLWDRPLSLDEIRREMRSRFAIARSGLRADLPLLFDNSDLVARSVWTESGTITTEVGPILGGYAPRAILPFAAGATIDATPIWLPGHYV